MTYGDLIDLVEEAEDCACASDKTSVSEVLYSMFQMRYPHIAVSRSQRLYDAAMRIIAPTRPSLRGTSKLNGLALSSYRSKEWLPRTRLVQPTEGMFYHL